MKQPDRFPPLRIEAWLTDPRIKNMDPVARGGLFQLLLHAWSKFWPDCSLPGDNEKLSELSGLGTVWFTHGLQIREAMTSRPDGRLEFDLLIQEKNRQTEFNKQRAEAGSKGIPSSRCRRPFRYKDYLAMQQPKEQGVQCGRTEPPLEYANFSADSVEDYVPPEAFKLTTPEVRNFNHKRAATRVAKLNAIGKWFADNPNQLEAFERFYETYPRHTDREDAKIAWKNLNPGEELITVIMVTLQAQLDGGHFPHFDDGTLRKEFIMQSSRWLNGKHWNDEIVNKERRSRDGSPTPGNGTRKHGHADKSGTYDGRASFEEHAAKLSEKSSGR